jgi:hypothetical protein
MCQRLQELGLVFQAAAAYPGRRDRKRDSLFFHNPPLHYLCSSTPMLAFVLDHVGGFAIGQRVKGSLSDTHASVR